MPPDVTPPSVTITTPVGGATYVIGQSLVADYACQDAGSGIASCTGPVADGAAIATNALGIFAFAVTATDNAGNTSGSSSGYRVGYGFSGFDTPVDQNVLNVAKAGRVIPLKWRLVDGNGNPITTLTTASATVVSLECEAGVTADAMEEYPSGQSGLQNLGNGDYQFNWLAPRSYAISCKTLHLDLGEGFTRTARFKFVR